MSDCTKCKCVDGTLFDALESIVWYNCHYEWLRELRDALAAHPESKNYLMPENIVRGNDSRMAATACKGR